MSWFRRTKEPRRVPYVLSDAALAWMAQGEREFENTKGIDMQKEFEIYVDGAHIGSADQGMFNKIIDEINPLAFSVGITHHTTSADVHVHSGGRATRIIRKAISVMDGAKEPTLKDAAAAFEKAINSEPGVEAKIVSIGAHDINAVITHTKWAVKVTRNERKQVYP